MSRSAFDHLLMAADNALRTLSGAAARRAPRPGPGAAIRPRATRSAGHSAGLMRVNHAARSAPRRCMRARPGRARPRGARQRSSARRAEERDHLAWCRQRLDELGSRPSLLGSVLVRRVVRARRRFGPRRRPVEPGVPRRDRAAGRAPSRRSPGDAAGSRRAQPRDRRADALRRDRARPQRRGARGPRAAAPVKAAMKLASKVMTRTAYWV